MILDEDCKLHYLKMNSPIGFIYLVSNSQYLLGCYFEDSWESYEKRNPNLHESKDNKILKEAQKQLNEYFSLKRTEFSLPLKLVGTDFQTRVWQVLQEIPFGFTMSYSEQAEKYGNIKSIRAVASANGRNPISIIVPCHRVIGKNGHLVGFGGGLDKKEYLLRLEGSRL